MLSITHSTQSYPKCRALLSDWYMELFGDRGEHLTIFEQWLSIQSIHYHIPRPLHLEMRRISQWESHYHNWLQEKNNLKKREFSQVVQVYQKFSLLPMLYSHYYFHSIGRANGFCYFILRLKTANRSTHIPFELYLDSRVSVIFKILIRKVPSEIARMIYEFFYSVGTFQRIPTYLMNDLHAQCGAICQLTTPDAYRFFMNKMNH